MIFVNGIGHVLCDLPTDRGKWRVAGVDLLGVMSMNLSLLEDVLDRLDVSILQVLDAQLLC